VTVDLLLKKWIDPQLEHKRIEQAQQESSVIVEVERKGKIQ